MLDSRNAAVIASADPAATHACLQVVLVESKVTGSELPSCTISGVAAGVAEAIHTHTETDVLTACDCEELVLSFLRNLLGGCMA